MGISFKEFESVTAKLRHAFTAIPAGKGLLSPCNWVLRRRPEVVYLHRHKGLLQAIGDAHTLLRESTTHPTRCKELVAGWPDYIGIKDASSHARDRTFDEVHHLPTSDLEMAGLPMLWLVMEEVVGDKMEEGHVALFIDNDPTVSWVKRLASRHSTVAAQLVRALALRIKLRRACPITPCHIPGVENAMTDTRLHIPVSGM